ncbi:MAG: PepSY domain-containing protein [Alphaproteobacteria bacterium]|nr:PepSY domain-containing protein [Alphaproteobacteria bacterium]
MRSEPKLNALFIRSSGSRAYLWAMRVLLILLAFSVIAGLPSGIAAQAQSDQKSARDAADAGEIKPLSEILHTVKTNVPGQVLDVQLDKTGKPWTYRIRVRSDKGNVVLVVVDAESGRILSTKGNR